MVPLAEAFPSFNTDRSRFPDPDRSGDRGVCPVPSRVKTRIATIPRRSFMGRQGKTSGDDKREGAMDKAKGRLKEATGALSGDSVKKSEGRSDQRRGTLKEKKGHLKDLFK
jgi:uncharacterized protein YjbJ (UPF0337 family)